MLRKFAGLTLEELAVSADTSIAYLSKVETGRLTPTRGYVAQVTAAIATRLRAAV
ncbi:MAG: transcriptional regulator, family [Rhodoglobus sp.]|nr:transcriptional regulator, family [Rhodoglobus sp.]